MISVVLLRTKKSRPQTEGGDTIVEVMIALTIMSFVIAGAYITSNSSLNNVRTAQERNEAVQIAQSQIESIRYNNGIPNINGNPALCFSGGNAQTGPPSLNCQFTNNGTNYCNSTTLFTTNDYCYTVVDSVVSTSSGTGSDGGAIVFNTYKTLVTWPGLSGSANKINNVVLYYRLDTYLSTIGDADVSTVCDLPSPPAWCESSPEWVPPPGGTYHYDITVANISDDLASSITGCQWIGSQAGEPKIYINNQSCNPGDNITFNFLPATDPPIDPSSYPYDCTHPNDPYGVNITLTEYLSNGSTPSYSYNDAQFPTCY